MATLKQVAARLLLACVATVASFAASAQTYSVGGAVHGLIGQGLQLQLSYTTSCLADGQVFTLHSTDPNDCFAPSNIAKCCSQSIGMTTFDGLHTVTCRCGITPVVQAILPSQPNDAGTETLNVPAGATAYTFFVPIPDISNYSALVQTQPTAPVQLCRFAAPSGVINGHAITNLDLDCSDRIFANGFD